MKRPSTQLLTLCQRLGFAAIAMSLGAGFGGCAADQYARGATSAHPVDSSRAAGDMGTAFDRFLPPTLTYAAPAHGVVVSPAVVTPHRFVHIPGGPPPASPPPLPVVRMDPKPHTPFQNGQEPPIRIGRSGPKAPPASQRRKGPLSYARIDARGNLIDAQGRILYHAGLNSPAVDTQAPEEQADVIYDSVHASPRQLVARSSQVPRIAGLKDLRNAAAPVGQPRSGAYAPLPGVHPVGDTRVKQFQIRDYDLPDERDYNVRVDNYAPAATAAVPTQPVQAYQQPAAAPVAAPAQQGYAAPTGVANNTNYGGVQAQPYVAPVAAAPVAEAAPMNDLGVSSLGQNEIFRQVKFKGAKERRVQRLYKRGMKDLKKNNYRLATSVFKKLLKRYPKHELADNALYWMGEGAYARGDWLQAMTWFQDVILRYPEGNKLPDAMLKSALCYAKLGDTSYAVQMLTEVETLFSGLPVSQVARQRRLSLSGGM